MRIRAEAPVKTSLTEYHTDIPATSPRMVAGREKSMRYLPNGIPRRRRAICHVLNLSSMPTPVT